MPLTQQHCDVFFDQLEDFELFLLAFVPGSSTFTLKEVLFGGTPFKPTC